MKEFILKKDGRYFKKKTKKGITTVSIIKYATIFEENDSVLLQEDGWEIINLK